MRKCDVLIIGCGIAGASAALALAEKGLDVVVLATGQSNSAWAQGGIVFRGWGDSAELLQRDIAAAGAGLCHPAAIDQMVRLGPPLIEKVLIDRLCVPFERNQRGEFQTTQEAAHSLPRILHHKDQTGLAIMEKQMAAIHAQKKY